MHLGISVASASSVLPRSQLQSPFDDIASAHKVQLSQPTLYSGLKVSDPITGI